jgi:hypothetical protein
MEKENVLRSYQPAYRSPALEKPLQLRLRQEARERQKRADAEARERQEAVQAEENATVRLIVSMLGVYPEDPAGLAARDLTAADVRYVVRAAYRHGRSSRG